jgi:hypothetical protein
MLRKMWVMHRPLKRGEQDKTTIYPEKGGFI